jgi:hypothetical protein
LTAAILGKISKTEKANRRRSDRKENKFEENEKAETGK